jgi:hypothetical protein
VSTHRRPAGRVGVGLLLIAALALTSCVTGTRLSEEDDRKAKAFSPPTGKANVYIARGTRMAGGSVHAAVYMGNQRSRSTTWDMSEVGNGAYCVFTRPAGNYTVHAAWGDGRGQRTLKLRRGRCYFYKIGLGGFVHVDIDPLGAAAGRELVLDSVGVVVERTIEIPLSVLGVGESERNVGSPLIISVPGPSLPKFKQRVRHK